MTHLKWKMFVTSMQLALNKTYLMQYSLMKTTRFQIEKRRKPQKSRVVAVLHSLSLFRNHRNH